MTRWNAPTPPMEVKDCMAQSSQAIPTETRRGEKNEGVQLHILNAPKKMMKQVGYGKGYKYNPDFKEPVDQEYLPESLKGRKYLDV